MRKIIVTEWMSLDGYVSGPNNDMSFISTHFDAQMGAYEGTIVDRADTLILGRLTYESFAGSWPNVAVAPETTDEERVYAQKLGAVTKVVFSTTLQNPEWENTLVHTSIDAEAIKALKAQDGKDILIYGSASIVQELTKLGLIDEYQLLLYPTLLGGGKALFAGVTAAPFKLVDTEIFGSGIVKLTYAR